jgi:energy-converting hydrogenase Eha subunit C
MMINTLLNPHYVNIAMVNALLGPIIHVLPSLEHYLAQLNITKVNTLLSPTV